VQLEVDAKRSLEALMSKLNFAASGPLRSKRAAPLDLNGNSQKDEFLLSKFQVDDSFSHCSEVLYGCGVVLLMLTCDQARVS
jgi:hypothetical protein